MKQTFSQWQSNPAQGAMPCSSPFTDADEAYLAEVVVECRVRLESALSTAEGYRVTVPELATALADAVTACQQASAVLKDLPTYSDGDTKGELVHVPNPGTAVIEVINAEMLSSSPSGKQDHRGGGC